MARIVGTKRMLLGLAASLTLSLAFSGVAQASTDIQPGFDLFATAPGTSFFFGAPVPNTQFVDFEGVPLGTFDFGSGPVSVGKADTIVQRLQLADLSPGNDTIDIEIVALSLQSVDPVDLGFGAGFEFIYITLNTSSPSLQSQMTIQDTGEGSPHGKFDSTLNFSFDVVGSVGGFYATLEKTIEAQNELWEHDAGAGLQITGVNYLLNGLNTSGDFWPIGFVIHDDGSGTAIHRVTSVKGPASAPALSPIAALLLTALMGAGLVAYRRNRV